MAQDETATIQRKSQCILAGGSPLNMKLMFIEYCHEWLHSPAIDDKCPSPRLMAYMHLFPS